MAGIYMIKCLSNGRYYIGGTSREFAQRFNNHRQDLRRRKGPRLLQACFDLYGEDALEFIPLRELPVDQVATKEREAIEKLKPDLNVYGARAKLGAAPGPDYITPYDVGGRQLTAPQIAAEAGVTTEAILARLRRGVTGPALLAGRHKGARKPYIRTR